MFKENPEFHENNRALAARSFTRQALLADNTRGIVFQYGKFPISLTHDEAIRIATEFVNHVEAGRQ